MDFDVLVLGAGPAGLMCAIEAARGGKRVAVREHNAEIGRKILISGGGRCNFTNLHTRPEHFLSANPHFAKSALARYPPEEFLKMVRAHGIPYHEKKDGQLFCDRSARDITRMLAAECGAARVRVVPECRIRQVRREAGFAVETSRGEFRAACLTVATGGLSIPKIGATDLGYRLARQFGLRIVPCRPALVPLTLPDRFRSLAGVAAEVRVSSGGQTIRERLLVTHRGLSGPAILQISSYWREGQPLVIDLAPGVDTLAELRARKRRGDRSELTAVIAEWLPRRLAAEWLQGEGFSTGLVAQYPDDELERLSRLLHGWTVIPNGTEGYAKAEVTAGGVDTRDLSSQTMEARAVPGLFFAGEVIDVTGHLGGFNFQWAWASGWAAGKYIAAR